MEPLSRSIVAVPANDARIGPSLTFMVAFILSPCWSVTSSPPTQEAIIGTSPSAFQTISAGRSTINFSSKRTQQDREPTTSERDFEADDRRGSTSFDGMATYLADIALTPRRHKDISLQRLTLVQ